MQGKDNSFVRSIIAEMVKAFTFNPNTRLQRVCSSVVLLDAAILARRLKQGVVEKVFVSGKREEDELWFGAYAFMRHFLARDLEISVGGSVSSGSLACRVMFD